MDRTTFDKRIDDTLRAFRSSFGWQAKDLAHGLKKAGRDLPWGARRAGARLLAAQAEMAAAEDKAETVDVGEAEEQRPEKPPVEPIFTRFRVREAQARAAAEETPEPALSRPPEPAPRVAPLGFTYTGKGGAAKATSDAAEAEEAKPAPQDEASEDAREEASEATHGAEDAPATPPQDPLTAQREKAAQSLQAADPEEPVDTPEPAEAGKGLVADKRAEKQAAKAVRAETRRLDRAFDRLQEGIASVDIKELRARRRLGALASAAFNLLLLLVLVLIVLSWRGLI